MAGIDIKTIQGAIPNSLKEKGIGKINQLITKQSIKITNELQPQLDKIKNQLPEQPDLCLSDIQIQKILEVRNNIIDKLNQIQKILDISFISIGITSGILGALIETTSILRTAKTAISAGSAAAPVIPGVVVSTINSLNDLLDFLRFDQYGNSKLNPTKIKLDSSSIPVALASVSIKNFILTLNTIDAFLQRCATPNQLASLNTILPQTISIFNTQNIIDELVLNNQQSNESLYQGFILEIEEKEYAPNIKQYRAVGKNSQGITLISTPYSFTSTPQILINELKLIIDRDNLKAY